MARHRYVYPFFAPPYRQPGPYLPINFVNPATGQGFRWHCLIDTGADSCLLPRSIADATGHNLQGKGVQSSVTMGVEGGSLSTYKHTFVMELLNPDDNTLSVWHTKKLLVECVDHDAMPPLLGQSDFLRHFKLTIDYREQTTTLEWAPAKVRKKK